MTTPDAQRTGSRFTQFLRSVFSNLQDLFTQGVTRQGLRDLVQRDARDTFRFFTSEIDFAELRPLPWYKRYPRLVWRIFVALAYRMSPPRRIAFLVATVAFIQGWYRFTVLDGSGTGWWLIAIAIFVILLLMELRDKLDLKGDLEIACEIQVGLAPSQPFSQDGITIHCQMRPANTVGGDYHDIVSLGESRIGVVVGDVSGKGMPAALLAALLQGSLRTLITAGLRGSELITKLNQYLCASTPANSLVTLFYAELDTTAGDLRFVNAGHNAPFLVRSNQTLERLGSTSLVLGFLKETIFEMKNARLDPGDRLLIFTDGVTEAFNAGEKEYGEERLSEILRKHKASLQNVLIQEIIADVLNFCDSEKPGDDMTLMVIGRPL